MFFSDRTAIEAWLIATLFFMARYLLIAGLFYMVFYGIGKGRFTPYKIQKRWPGLGQIKAEMGYSLLTLTIYGSAVWLFVYWINAGFTKRYVDVATYGLPYCIMSIVLMIALHDTYFYWTHRLMHHPKVFRYVHKTHHGFNSPTP